jgi:hypothetical protein
MRSLVRLVLFAIALGASAHARAEDEVEVSLYWNGQRLTKICRSYLKASRRELLTVAEVQDKGLCQGYVVEPYSFAPRPILTRLRLLRLSRNTA